MTDPKQKKILERIRKLLAMANDAGSPNEAAIAAKRAKALMNKHNVSEGDALGAHLDLDDIGEKNVGPKYARFPKWMSQLAIGVAKYSDTHVVFGWAPRTANGTRRKVLTFRGELTDLEVADYLFTYLTRTINRLCQEQGFEWPAERDSFKKGAALEVVDTLERMAKEEREWFAKEGNKKALVLVDKKQQLIKRKFGQVGYAKGGRFTYGDGGAMAAGKAAGAGVSVRRGVSGTSKGPAGYLS
jgi:hypothetical protein